MQYNKIFKSRDLWMGVATLWIMLFHSRFNIPLINYVKYIGYGGVDIFFFASGVGCYFSLKHDSDNWAFIKRRMNRILPTYFIFLFFWFLYKLLVDSITLKEILGNIFCVGCIIGLKNQFNWYMNGIWIMYIIAPFLFSFINQKSSKKRIVIFILVMLLASIPFFNTNMLIVITRLPVYFIGFYFASQSEKNDILGTRQFSILVLLMCFGVITLFLFALKCNSLMWKYGLWWYPFIFITPGLCFIISFISNYCYGKIGRVLKKIILFVGKYSFEIYLVHVFFYDILKRCIKSGFVINTNLNWLIVSLIVIPFSFLLKKITNKVVTESHRLKHHY